MGRVSGPSVGEGGKGGEAVASDGKGVGWGWHVGDIELGLGWCH